LTTLNLQHNPLVTFIGGDLQLLSTIDLRNRGLSSLDGWNITTLESIDITGMDNLRYLYVANNTSINNTSVNNSLLAKLAANELVNDWGSGKFYTTGGRTSAGTDDYDYLINEGWTIEGADLTPTFITSKADGQFISLDIETTEGYWKYLHDGVWSEPFETGSYSGNFEIEITNEDGEFTLVSCDFEGTETGDITFLTLNSQELTSFDGTGLTSLLELGLSGNRLTEFDGTDLTSLTDLNLSDNQLTEFDGTDLTSLTSLDLSGNQLTTIVGFLFPTSLTNLHLGYSKENLNNNLTSVDLSSLVNLTTLNLEGNQLTTLDISNMDYLQNLYVNDNLLTASVNNSLLAKLAANELSNDWDSGQFYTTGGRTSTGTDDYDYLITNSWDISGADLPPVWYRFKAPSTEPWDGTIGVDSNQLINQVYLYQSGGFTYYDFLTSETIGEVKFNVQGTETEIVATQVQVTLQEFSSSGSFTAGGGFGGVAIGYSNSPLGNWGTLNSGTLPALPSRYEGQIPAGSVIFTDFDNTISGDPFALITAPILISLTLNDDVIDLTGMYGGPEGTLFDIYKNPPRTPFGFQDGETYTFSMTWGELVETPISRKLRVKGVGQLNP
jgi:hypothetical protein